MAEKKVNIQINTKADTAGAKQAADAMGKIGTNSKRSSDETAKGANKMAYSLGNVGNQVQDIAVQIESGTDKLRVFAQQAPQIAGAFGPQGAIAGAFLALGAIAYKFYTDSEAQLQTTKEKADELAEAINGVAKVASALSAEELDYGLASIKKATEQTYSLASAFDQSKKSAEDYSTATAANLEKVRLAMVALNRLNGEQVDDVAEVAKATDAADAVRLQKANAEIAAQQKRKEDAALAVQTSATELEQTAKISTETQLKIQQLEKLIEKRREERDLLIEQDKIARKQSVKDIYGISTSNLATRGAAYAAESSRRESATQSIDTTKGVVTLLEKQLADLEATVQQGGKISEAVIKAAEKLAADQAQQNDVEQSVITEIAKIQQTFNADQITAEVKSLDEMARSFSSEVTTTLESIKPTNDLLAKGLAQIAPLTKDGSIIASELLQTGAGLNTILQGLPTSAAEQRAQVSELIQIMNRYQAENNETRAAINALKAQKSTPLRTN